MPKAKKVVSDPNKVVGYIRVSTEEQADSGLGLAAQRAAVAAEAEKRGWTLVAVHEDAQSGKSLDRPGLDAALAAVEAGEAGGIVVAKLDRLSRSLMDFALLMERAQKGGWNLVACDLGIDLSTPSGEFMPNVMASAAQWERRIIGIRTRDALAVKRAQGVKLGRPHALPQAVVERIVAARNAGEGWSAIARALNDESRPYGARGGKVAPLHSPICGPCVERLGAACQGTEWRCPRTAVCFGDRVQDLGQVSQSFFDWCPSRWRLCHRPAGPGRDRPSNPGTVPRQRQRHHHLEPRSSTRFRSGSRQCRA